MKMSLMILTFQISNIFGGLGICSLEAMVAKDGKEYIIEVNDSACTLMGESQEDDRKNIAELVLRTMEVSLVDFSVDLPLIWSIILQKKLKVAAPQNNETDAKESNQSNAATPGSKPSAIRQLSRGSLGLGENTMASTVLSAMTQRKKEKAAEKPDEQSNQPAAKPQPPPPPQKPVAPTEKEVAPKPKEASPAAAANNRRRHDSQGGHKSCLLSQYMFVNIKGIRYLLPYQLFLYYF